MARWIESVAGVLAALVAVAVAAAMVVLGAYSWAVAVVGLGGLGAGTAAWLHSRRQEGPWLTLLWVSALVLVIMTVLDVFSIGIFLFPGTVAALIAAVAGTCRSSAGGGAVAG